MLSITYTLFKHHLGRESSGSDDATSALSAGVLCDLSGYLMQLGVPTTPREVLIIVNHPLDSIFQCNNMEIEQKTNAKIEQPKRRK